MARQGSGDQLLGQLVCALCQRNAGFFPFARALRKLGVQFVGIGLDDIEKMQAFASTTPVAYPLLASDFASQSSFLEIKGLPLTLVIARDGHVEMVHLGPLDEAMLEPVLERLIGK